MSTKMSEEDWAHTLAGFRACLPRRGRKAGDDRRFLEALHFLTVENVRWRALPERFGPCNSVWKRFDRLSKAGVFEAFFDTLGVDPNDFFDVAETKARLEAAIDATNHEIDRIRETRETSERPEKVETELKSLLEVPADAPRGDELHRDGDERRLVDLAERNRQPAEPAGERAKVEQMAEYAALSDEQPWWRRLVGWIRMRRGWQPRSGYAAGGVIRHTA
jgi:transposase